MKKYISFIIGFVFKSYFGFSWTIGSSLGNNVCFGETTTLYLLQSNGTVYNSSSVTWYSSAPTAGNQCTGAVEIGTGTYFNVTITGTRTIWAKPACGVSNTGALVSITLNSKPKPPIPGISPANPTICQGANITLNAPNGYSNYSWSTGATTQTIAVNISGTFSCTVTGANGCVSSYGSTNVYVAPLPTASITALGPTTVCQGNNVIINANTGIGLTYQWTLNGSNISTATASSYSATATGTYVAIVTNTANCSKTSNAISVNVTTCTGLKKLETELISVTPNPVNDFIFLEIEKNQITDSKYEIYDSSGKLILSGTLNNQTTEINAKELKRGLYILNIATKDKGIVKRIIKE